MHIIRIIDFWIDKSVIVLLCFGILLVQSCSDYLKLSEVPSDRKYSQIRDFPPDKTPVIYFNGRLFEIVGFVVENDTLFKG